MFDIFFFNDTATTEIYTLSLHDALPISPAMANTITLVPNDPVHIPDESQPRIVGCERSEEHTSELQSQSNLVCRLLLEKKKIFLPSLIPPHAFRYSTSLSVPCYSRTSVL